MDDPKETSRRNFIKLATATTLMAGASRDVWGSMGTYLIEPRQQQAQTASPNDRIRIATIGVGGQGMSDTNAALRRPGPSTDQANPNPLGPGVEVVAVADLYDGRLTRAQEIWGKQLFTTRDHHEILARPDVDAVIVATPDHWHMQIAVDAMKAGKDVYLEKPMVQSLDQGKVLIDAARATNRILQVGSQRVSSIVYQKAKELYNAAAIGELNLVEAWWNRNSALGAWQYTLPPDASAQTIDWERFLGKAAKVPFDPIRFFRWRNYRDYGTGVAGDLFVHLFSGMHFVTGAIGPTRVYATGGLRFWKDRDVPDVMLGFYDYAASDKHPAFNLALRFNFVNGPAENSGFRFIGSEGILSIGNGVTVSKQPREAEPGYTIDTFPKAVQEQFLKAYREKYPPQRPSADAIRPQAEDKYLPPQGYSDHLDHHRNFIAAVRSRKPVVEDATFGYRAAAPALLSNVSYFEKKVCLWDPKTMTSA